MKRLVQKTKYILVLNSSV